jgi:glycosyltransferase involved in cell wall biosynthesis
MKFSVAMCTYNGSGYLPEQLRSIAAQTRPPDELIVCDDRSTDRTKDVVDDFSKLAPFRVQLHINQETLGSTQNFEKAIRLCSGDIIALSDQDDVWHPEKLRKMEAQFRDDPNVGLVFSDLAITDECLRPLGFRAWECEWVEFGQLEQQLCNEGKILDVLLTRNVVTGSALGFRSKFKQLILPIPEISKWEVHDHWIALVIAAVADVRFIDEPLVKYRRHTGQQLGLLTPLFEDSSSWATAWRRTNAYPVRSRLLKLLSERLRRDEASSDYTETIAMLEDRFAHAQVRDTFPAKRYGSRALAALKELLTFRYQRFPHPNSNALIDAANDFLPYRILFFLSRWANSREQKFRAIHYERHQE